MNKLWRWVKKREKHFPEQANNTKNKKKVNFKTKLNYFYLIFFHYFASSFLLRLLPFVSQFTDGKKVSSIVVNFLLRVCVYKNLLYYLIRPFTNTLKHCTVPFKPFKQFNYEWVSFSLSFNSNSLGIKQRPFLKEIKLSSLLQASVNAPCTLTHSLSLVSLLFLILFLFLFFTVFLCISLFSPI